MVYAVGCLAALRDPGPRDAVERVLRRLTADDIGAVIQRRSSGDRWETVVVELPEGGMPSLEVHQYDYEVDLMTSEAERLGIDVSFMPDSFVTWYPRTSELGLADVVLTSVLNDADLVWWDSVNGFLLDRTRQSAESKVSPPG